MKNETNFFKMFAPWGETKGKHTTAEIMQILKDAGFVLHHFALRRGYVSSRTPYVEKYEGKFGEGWILNIPNNETSGARQSNRYHEIAYFV